MDQNTILCIARDTVTYLHIKDLLKVHDVILLRAFDIDEVKEILCDFTIDTVLFDASMFPPKEVISIIGAIKKINQPLPVIVLSTHSQSEYKAQCIDAGCNEFLVSPLNTSSFHQILNKYCSTEACMMH